MTSNYCPRCAHCQAIKEYEEQAEKRRRDLEEEKRRMEEELRAAERRLKEEGAIYGNRYELYTIAEIEKITNIDFLNEMLDQPYPCAQPKTDEELHELFERRRCIEKRLNDVLLENL